jgi:hypothetical protein
MTPIYRWSGQYFGFISNDRLFDASSHYLGWITEDGRVWRANGSFLGEIEDENYILRRTSMSTPSNRSARSRPSTPSVPSTKSNRSGRSARSGRVDALEEFD